MNRIPVKFKGKCLMPMKCSRAERYIKEGKAKLRYDRKLDMFYLQLLVKPSNTKKQGIAIGIDPGSCFDGFSVVSADTHHLNIELIQRDKKGDKSIKYLMERRAMYRRLRRSRKRHRKMRFDFRNKKNMTPTIRANVEFRTWLITKLTEYFPISVIGIEDVCFNHHKSNKGGSFSPAEQGKTALYSFVRDLGIDLLLFKGHETHKLRNEIWGYDPKVKSKGSEVFEAHCIDSFVIALACIQSTKKVTITRRVTFIQKAFRYRRFLFQLRPTKYKGNNRYYRLLKGGIKEYYDKKSRKRNICRVKLEGDHSNHPKKWNYIDNGFADKKKMRLRKFGGKPTPRNPNGEYLNRYIRRNNT